MTEERALTTIEGTYVPALAISVEQAVARQRAFYGFIKEILVDGVDYAAIPGTEKKSLMKPGAEKLANAFAFSIQCDPVKELEDWDKGRFYFQYRCELRHRATGVLISTCNGSANSMEGKYRWRNISENKATEAEKARAVRTETRKGRYGPYNVVVVENDDPYTLVNTLQKMAQKRAFVGAVLLATNASAVFTQDLEDMVVEGEVVEPEPPATQNKAGRRAPAPEAATVPAPPTETGQPTERSEMDARLTTWLVSKNHLEMRVASKLLHLWTLKGITDGRKLTQAGNKAIAAYGVDPAQMEADLNDEIAQATPAQTEAATV